MSAVKHPAAGLCAAMDAAALSDRPTTERVAAVSARELELRRFLFDAELALPVRRQFEACAEIAAEYAASPAAPDLRALALIISRATLGVLNQPDAAAGPGSSRSEGWWLQG